MLALWDHSHTLLNSEQIFFAENFQFGATCIKKDRQISTEMKKNLHLEIVIEENCLSTDGYSDDRLIAKFHETVLLHELKILVHPAKVLNVFTRCDSWISRRWK